MRAVITVIGKDMVGILAKISTECCNHNINVLEVTQSILQDMFAMIMMPFSIIKSGNILYRRLMVESECVEFRNGYWSLMMRTLDLVVCAEATSPDITNIMAISSFFISTNIFQNVENSKSIKRSEN